MILSTTPTIEGHPIREYRGVVTGETIIGTNFVKDFFAFSIFFLKSLYNQRLFVFLHRQSPTKPLNDAQMCGSFLYIYVSSQNTLMERYLSPAIESEEYVPIHQVLPP